MRPAPLPHLTESENETYRRAVRLWRSFCYRVRAELYLRRTFGARVTRTRGFTRRAA
jgi:hypothetical protein